MINKTFRLFISSTFSDFLSERNLLNDEIFPVVDEYCQNRGYNFQLIDLRWGINTESALNQKTISICLDEVERCTTLSPRPNFLVMAGERYGWVPLPYQFTPDDYNDICANASYDEKNLLDEWYIYDSNEIGGCYYLKERTDEYVDDRVWFEKEKELRDILIRLVDLIDDESGRFNSYKMSATEHEIFAGLFNKIEQSDSVIALFRTGFPDKDESQEMINNLKRRIEERLSSVGCQENIINLEWDENYSHFFVERITNILLKNIKKEIDRLERIKDDQNLLEKEFRKNNQNLNIDKIKLETIQAYVDGNENKPLFVVGESGSGKSTILSEFVCRTEKNVFYSFFGVGENSYSLLDSLRAICNKIKKEIGVKADFNITKNNITEKINDLLYSIPAQEKIVVLLDGFDSFYDLGEIHETVLPEVLPDNVKLIVSIAEKSIYEKFYIKNSPILLIDKFDSEKSYKTVEQLLSYTNRCISNTEQIKCIKKSVENGATPLQIKLLSEIASGWYSGENVRELPNDVRKIAHIYITDMYKKYGHNKELLLCSMALIAISPYGITEDELLKLLFNFEQVKLYFQHEDRYNHSLNKLPFSVWSRMFYDLKGCLTLTQLNGDIVIKFVHQIFQKVILDEFKDYCEQAQKILTSFNYEQKNFVNEKIPNKRKALCLSELLKKASDLEGLSHLLSDLTFIDATIKVGRLEDTISDILYLAGNDKTQEIHLSILNTLQENRELLSCYKGELFSLLEFIESIKRPFDVVLSKKESKCIYFPYSKNSKISWFEDGSMMAVYHKRYVYIYSNVLSKELCRMYVSSSLDENITVVNVIWMDCCTIAITTNLKELYIYSFKDDIPNEICHRNLDKDCVKYSKDKKMLFFIKDSCICSLNPFEDIENYRIDLTNIGKYCDVEFDIDSASGEIAFRNRGGMITTYDIDNGKKKREIKFRCLIASKYLTWTEKKLSKISESKWLMYNRANYEFMIYDNAKKTINYLLPPIELSHTKMLIGRKSFLLYNEQVLYWIDISDTFGIYYYIVNDINSFSWSIFDEELSILTSAGLQFLKKSDMVQFENSQNCLVSKKPVFGKLFFSVKNIGREFLHILKVIVPSKGNYLNYKTIFEAFSYTEELEEGIKNDAAYPTIIEYGDGNIKAVAFEEKDCIVLYDKKDEKMFTISNLKLAINDNILKMQFSSKSKFLLLWRNHSIQIFETKSFRCVLNLNIAARPVFDVWFEDDEVNIVFSDGSKFTSLPTKFKELTLPRKTVGSVDEDQYIGPYKTYVISDNNRHFMSMLKVDNLNFLKFPGEWLSDDRVYSNGEITLLFQDGEFYLNADKKLKFNKGFNDFSKSIEIERFKDDTPKKSYLREKNDLFSKLYQLDGFIVLVTHLMNSIIVFDINKMCVIGAYKHSSNIIGSRLQEENILEVTCECQTDSFLVEFNF